jgi:Septum formation
VSDGATASAVPSLNTVVGKLPTSPFREEENDLARTLDAIDRERSLTTHPTQTPAQQSRSHSRIPSVRQLLITALSGLLVAGIVAVLQIRDDDAGRRPSGPVDPGVHRATVVFGNAKAGDCLTWPDNQPDQPSFVLCRDDHLFEVAAAVDMDNFQEPCQLTVQRYLGRRYDPDGKFTAGVLWPGDGTGPESPERRLLCGLQLLGPDGRPIPFKGKVADADQSKTWAPGTCLSLDEATGRPTDIPVDCAGPHAAEVTGTVNLADRFGDSPPEVADQDAFLSDACTRITDTYLAPTTLADTGLSVHYNVISPASWSAGSRQVSCRIGVTRPDRSWAASTGSAKGPSTPVPAATPSPVPATSEPKTVSTPAPASTSTVPPPTTSATPPATSATPPTTSTTEAATTTTGEPPPPPAEAPGPSPAPPAEAPGPSPAPPAEAPGPPPAPPAEAPGPPPETTPPPNVLDIPGLGPITFPAAPPAPAPPPPPG